MSDYTELHLTFCDWKPARAYVFKSPFHGKGSLRRSDRCGALALYHVTLGSDFGGVAAGGWRVCAGCLGALVEARAADLREHPSWSMRVRERAPGKSWVGARTIAVIRGRE